MIRPAALSVLLLAGCVESSQPASPVAELRGTRVVVEGGVLSFGLPDYWVELSRRGAQNVHLPGTTLAAAEHGKGEWKEEYAQVANAILPFRFAVAHAGSGGWPEGRAFGDLQMRAYLGDFDAKEVHAAAAALSGRGAENPLFGRVQHLRTGSGPWRGSRLRYRVWYGDYGGPAIVDVYTRRVGTRTAAFVFMYAEEMGAGQGVAPILASVRSRR